MAKLLIASVLVLALTVPAGATTQWEGSPTGQFSINLTIDGWIQIDRQDSEINFDGAGDWWSTQLQGLAYAACPDDDGKFPTDAWAGDNWYGPRWYESGDGAVIFVRSNTQLAMKVTTNGDMENSGGATLPTHITVALCPFMVGGSWLTGHNFPTGECEGCYLSDAGGNTFGACVAGKGWPTQEVFACNPSGGYWDLGPMDPEVEGTIKFLARVERNGMADPPGTYTTNVDVDFTAP